MVANSKVSPLFFTSSFLIFFQLFLVSVIEANNNGFTIDLIHRDSPLSPYYNSSIFQMERLNKACHRSYERAASFKPTSYSSGTIQSPISRIDGEYLMKVSIGTPPVEMLSIADTGSNLAWVQCKPCPQCYKQIAPLFDPENSSTYKNMVCQSQYCEAVGRSSCASNNTCLYMVSYGDKSYTNGDLAAETFTFGSTSGQSVSIPQVVFGCGHQNNGIFSESTSGIVGLGGGTLSIVNQLNKYIDGKFSYCLVPFGASSDVMSKLNFGSNAIVSGPQVVSTPLVQKAHDTYYYLTLEGISVGDNKLAYKRTLSNSKASSTVEAGNIIIDSGTTLTLLPQQFYDNLESTLEQSISGQRTSDSNGIFSLCYKSDGNINFPKITFHFTDADLEPSSTFVEVEAGVICLTMVPVDEDAIFGNLSQMDFLVGYDLVNKKVSFLPTDCTKQS